MAYSAKGSKAQRVAQNKRTMGKQYGASIKIGAKGKNYNRYDPKTGRWVKVASASGAKPKMGSAKASSRTASSGTVSSAVAQGKKAGKGSGNGVKAGDNQGYVRGNPYAQQAAVTAKRTGRQPMPGAVQAQTKNKREQDKRNQGRDAALIAGLTVGAAVAGAGLVGRGGVAAGGAARKAIEAAGRKALPAGRKAIGPSGRVVKSTRPAPARVTVEDLRKTSAGASQIPKAATKPKAIEGPAPMPKGVSRTGGPATAKGNPRKLGPKAPTAAQKKKLAAYEANRPAKIPAGATRTSPIGNPRLDGTKNTGPKTLSQVRSERARKASAARWSAQAKKK